MQQDEEGIPVEPPGARPTSERLEQLLRAHLERGERNRAVDLLVRGHGPELLRFLERMLGNRADAMETFSDVCFAIFEHIDDFRWESPIRSWAFAIARNTYKSYLADPARRRRAPGSVTSALEALDVVVRTTTLDYLRTDFKDAFARIRQKLDPDDVALLHLRFDCQLPWREVARAMLGPGAVSDAALKRKTAAVRKEFERLKRHVRALAEQEGLLASGANE
ncbi:sigma-70 family RNA polymerase sigma factor [Sorangium sp. So ce375]|uniref:RNA polymerase sigma factor n=1 Tax=Sorangium sp. So ce375 TaxID=3133306 RepID=UPI003F5C823A